MLDAVRRALSLELVGLGLAVAFVAVSLSLHPTRRDPTESRLAGMRRTAAAIWTRHRAACRAGLALLAAGVAVYLPMNAVCGRYTIPAVWGGDLWIAALLGALCAVPASGWRHAATALIGCALIAIVIHNVAKQGEFLTRAATLWDVLDWIESHTPPGASVDWVAGPTLDVAEGIHTAWHLRARGGGDRRIRLLDASGSPVYRRELATIEREGLLIVTDGKAPPLPGRFGTPRHFSRTYWFGTRRHTCAVWQRDAS
jgi:hypothetical protein